MLIQCELDASAWMCNLSAFWAECYGGWNVVFGILGQDLANRSNFMVPSQKGDIRRLPKKKQSILLCEFHKFKVFQLDIQFLLFLLKPSIFSSRRIHALTVVPEFFKKKTDIWCWSFHECSFVFKTVSWLSGHKLNRHVLAGQIIKSSRNYLSIF